MEFVPPLKGFPVGTLFPISSPISGKALLDRSPLSEEFFATQGEMRRTDEFKLPASLASAVVESTYLGTWSDRQPEENAL